jgi:uncharacterized membrane protein YjjP (DUF1212 family)
MFWRRARKAFSGGSKPAAPATECVASPRDALNPDTALAMRFVAEAGKQMLEASPSVSEVLDRLRAFLPVVGLQGAMIDANLSTLTLSYWEPDMAFPVTTMRDVRASEPRLERMAETVSLLERVERKEIELAPAYEQLQTLAQAPRMRRRLSHTAILVSVVGWVLFLNGIDLVTVLVALLAMTLTFPVNSVVGKLRLPLISGTFAAAVILAAVPNLLAAAGVTLSIAAAVVGGLFIYLPGRAFVTAVIDSLANAPVSAITRAFEALLTAGALALGVVVGGEIGAGLGVEIEADFTSAPLWISVLASAVGVLGIAVAWGMPRARVIPTVVIGAVGWLIVAVPSREGSVSSSLIYLAAATFVGFACLTSARMQGGTASVYTGVAILPLVPGFSIYQGMLALATGVGDAAGPLKDAAVISLCIAGGVAIGLSLGRNAFSLVTWLRSKVRPTPAEERPTGS